MAKERGAAVISSGSHDDSPPASGESDRPDPTVRDPDVVVATMEQ